jgi:serine/threonine protein kinase
LRPRSNHQVPSASPISPFGQFIFPKTHHRRDSIASIASSKSFSSNLEPFSPEERVEVNNIFFGTPDYLAPESIMGGYQDTPVDWVRLDMS